MSERIQVGPIDGKRLPHQSLGTILYNEMQKKDPDRVIIVDDGTGEEVTYGQLLNLSIKLAVGLSNSGVKKGDVITIVSQNNWRCVITVIAGFYVGATVNLLNHDYTSGELKHFLSICKPSVIFCTSKTLENVLKLTNEPFVPKNIIIYDAESTGQVKNFDSILVENPTEEFSPVVVDPKQDVALILTSSGTTGLPKCVMLTHTNFRLTISYTGDQTFLDLNPEERTIVFLPMFHIFGTALALASIYFGTKFVILDKFVPDRFLRILQEHQITKLFVVPPIILFLVKSPLVGKYDLSSVRDIFCAAAPLNKELEAMVETKLPVKSVRQIYGMTEVCGAATILPTSDKRYGSVGKAVTSFKIKVCDVNTEEILPANIVGELRMLGDGLMKGYLGNDEESKTAFDSEGFIKSGDLGYYDEEGYFFIVDRLKEIIKYKGFQVSPAELENLLMQHPAIKDAGVIGIPEERAGEVPLAFVVKQPNKSVTEEEIVRYIEENVSLQKRLYGGVKFVEEIPKSPSGKILRRKLKDLL